MNALHLLPLGAKTAPPVPTGGKPPTGEAPSSPKKTSPAPVIIGPPTGNSTAPAKSIGSGAAEQLVEARANTLRAANERKLQAEKKAAEAAKEAAEAKEQAANLGGGTLEREVGLVEGTLKVFVDLVDPVQKKSLFRVFGPEENNLTEPAAPKSTGVTNAYTRNSAPMPLKDVGVA